MIKKLTMIKLPNDDLFDRLLSVGQAPQYFGLFVIVEKNVYSVGIKLWNW